MTALQSSRTFAEIQLWTDKVFHKFGYMALLHESDKPGRRLKIVAYAVSIQHLHREITLKMQDLSGVDDAKSDDLAILHERVDRLRQLIIRHFAIEHHELAEKVEALAQRFPMAASHVSASLRR
jgi:hypothetical protein